MASPLHSRNAESFAIMRSIETFDNIYLCREFIDMRQGINGLTSYVEAHMQLSPFQNGLFVFTNKSRNRLKMLYWDKSGFALWLKRLEKERFKWPRNRIKDSVVINRHDLSLLLDGIDLDKIKPHQKLSYSSVL